MKPIGNLGPIENIITLEDLLSAVDQTHEGYLPAHINNDVLHDVVTITYEANTRNSRVMGYGGILAWGITIGILAERRRKARQKWHSTGTLDPIT